MNTIILEYNILRYAYARFSKELLLYATLMQGSQKNFFFTLHNTNNFSKELLLRRLATA